MDITTYAFTFLADKLRTWIVGGRESHPSHLKPIESRYNPTADCKEPQLAAVFSFLLSTSSGIWSNMHCENSIEVDPSSLNLPWTSIFPAGRQCKHWRKAEEGAWHLLDQVKEYLPGRKRKVPHDIYSDSQSEDSQHRRAKAFTDTAVSAATYMFPEASVARISVVTRFYLLAWLHDDVVEYGPDDAGVTMVDYILDNPPRSTGEPATSKSIVDEIIEGDERTGREVVDGLRTYTHSTRAQRTEFSGSLDFLDSREVDIAMPFIVACVKFANNIQLLPEEETLLRPFVQLVIDHGTMVNDLYSFEKEMRAHREQNATVINAVYYLMKELGISPQAAKQVTSAKIYDIEMKMAQEVRTLQYYTNLSQAQINFARALVQCAAGNLLFSITAKRYFVLLQ